MSEDLFSVNPSNRYKNQYGYDYSGKYNSNTDSTTSLGNSLKDNGAYGSIESSIILPSKNSFSSGSGSTVSDMTKMWDSNFGNNVGSASAEDAAARANRTAQLEQSQIDYNKAMYDRATGANSIKWDQVKDAGDFGEWLTANRGGGSNYLSQGLGVAGALTSGWAAYNDMKYKNKMADLEENKQRFYEDQVNRSNARQDKAQAAYDAAQK